MSNYRATTASVQASGLQLVKGARKTANVRCHTRCHTVPSTLTSQMQAEIIAAVRAGRSVAQTAKEYNCDRCVVTEIWLRAEIAALRGMSMRRVA